MLQASLSGSLFSPTVSSRIHAAEKTTYFKMIVAYAWSSQGWNIQLRRNFNDWKVDTLTELLKVLEDFKGLQEGADCLCWKEDRTGIADKNRWRREGPKYCLNLMLPGTVTKDLLSPTS
ncbi:hypothetical protein H5410_021443 [Solanum commersonii]|uniref:Uncharacterized protein n=1 Tax=Solanum commersonii TaxID=4109 RepID=A0A9J5ZC01_SOLCO|nr:hypothetical protein H5410_021443 [Solanum commersonii]